MSTSLTFSTLPVILTGSPISQLTYSPTPSLTDLIGYSHFNGASWSSVSMEFNDLYNQIPTIEIQTITYSVSSIGTSSLIISPGNDGIVIQDNYESYTSSLYVGSGEASLTSFYSTNGVTSSIGVVSSPFFESGSYVFIETSNNTSTQEIFLANPSIRINNIDTVGLSYSQISLEKPGSIDLECVYGVVPYTQSYISMTPSGILIGVTNESTFYGTSSITVNSDLIGLTTTSGYFYVSVNDASFIEVETYELALTSDNVSVTCGTFSMNSTNGVSIESSSGEIGIITLDTAGSGEIDVAAGGDLYLSGYSGVYISSYTGSIYLESPILVGPTNALGLSAIVNVGTYSLTFTNGILTGI